MVCVELYRVVRLNWGEDYYNLDTNEESMKVSSKLGSKLHSWSERNTITSILLVVRLNSLTRTIIISLVHYMQFSTCPFLLHPLSPSPPPFLSPFPPLSFKTSFLPTRTGEETTIISTLTSPRRPVRRRRHF